MYGFSTQLEPPFDDAISRVTEALKKEGFGILTGIDGKGAMPPSGGNPGLKDK